MSICAGDSGRRDQSRFIAHEHGGGQIDVGLDGLGHRADVLDFLLTGVGSDKASDFMATVAEFDGVLQVGSTAVVVGV